eukprot:403357297
MSQQLSKENLQQPTSQVKLQQQEYEKECWEGAKQRKQEEHDQRLIQFEEKTSKDLAAQDKIKQDIERERQLNRDKIDQYEKEVLNMNENWMI